MSDDEVAYGFVKVAIEAIGRPIRSLTEGKGYALEKHTLSSFGGAGEFTLLRLREERAELSALTGGQLACEIAASLGIKRILVHRHSSILSAYGLALADRVYELQGNIVS